MPLAIIDCGAGNLHSVRKAFAAVLPEGETPTITTDPAVVRAASHIVLPGVGAFGDCMAGLNALPGMREALEEKVHHGSTPFLGICVGMQMLFEKGHEHGVHDGLGWFKGEVAPLQITDQSLKIPQMGWNILRLRRKHPILDGIEEKSFVYFVHSYAARDAAPHDILADVDYGGAVVAIIGRDHIIGTQFHPEKSQAIGLRLLSNFLKM